jgi:hypothetical protein
MRSNITAYKKELSSWCIVFHYAEGSVIQTVVNRQHIYMCNKNAATMKQFNCQQTMAAAYEKKGVMLIFFFLFSLPLPRFQMNIWLVCMY